MRDSTTPPDAHDIAGQDARVDERGCWHRLTCACGWGPDVGPLPLAVAAEQEAFRQYAEHARAAEPASGVSTTPFAPVPTQDRRVWETGRRRRPVLPPQDV